MADMISSDSPVRYMFETLESLDDRIEALTARKAELKELLATMIPENEVVDGIRHKAWVSPVVRWGHFSVVRKDFGAVLSQEATAQVRRQFLKAAQD